ncbi:MAG: DMSO reductase family type II enzyme, molybdopterin subunit [Halomonas sp. 54_146]|nr:MULTISPECIES: molybdopterin-dependent oxidoreductase [unclassified Halomonas]KUJ86775.1 MAG: DMSO reductase family type II enzyme, molybdopterin subunit [Halomonas sp. 54_146]
MGMWKVKRRDFLKGLGLTGAGAMISGNAWALNRLEPIGDTLASEYPYRSWEDLYRNEWTWDSVGHAAHCINCMGNCAWNVYVKDGIVIREEQIAKYPQVNPNVPDANPRGCQKGAIHSTAMYEADRLRYPLKRAGERGEGKWQRISWDQATEEIADKVIDIFEKYGPGKLKTHQGSGNQTMVRQAGGQRFASLVGGIQLDGFTVVGDLLTGAHLTYGTPLESFTSDAWFDADYILLGMINPNATRIPDAHYVWEAKYNGARITSTAPDYNPSAIHTDLWMPINQGTDPFFAMSLVNVIIEEQLYQPAFMKEQSDLPMLVRLDNGKLLREADLVEGGSDEVFYHWDLNSSQAVKAHGSMGSDEKTIKLNGIDPALEGEFTVEGIKVTTVFEQVKREAAKFTPEATFETTNIHPDVVRQEARHLAKAKKAIVMLGYITSSYSNCLYTCWSYALALALTGHGGRTGGLDTSWISWNHPRWTELATFEGKKSARYEPGGLGEFLRGGMMEGARQHFDNAKLKARVGFDLDEMEEMIQESLDKGWMPYYGEIKGMISIADNTFRRNKFADKYREEHLRQASELYACINVRMDSTAEWADYVLPAASHYEAWDLRTQGYHRFCNVFTRSVDPVGDSKPDWEILVLLTKKIQERAIARGIGPIEDGDDTRDLHTIHDDFTRDGKFMTDEDVCRYIVENSPEFGDITLEEAGERGFIVMNEHAGVNQPLLKNEPYNPFVAQTEDKKPYDTLTGRLTFYVDHPRFMKLNSTVPTARLYGGPEASNYPLHFYSPHTRWGIHSNWRSNKYMLRLQRGEPNIYINPKLAAERGIKDGDTVRLFNSTGEFFAQAKFYPSIPVHSIMMEHGWEPHQYIHRKPMNNSMATFLQPLELVGGWGHLTYKYAMWNANQLLHESSFDIELAKPEDIADPRLA